MDTNKKNRELISALMDGALPEADIELAMAALGTPAGDAAWRRNHLIGDALREYGGPELSPGFAARLAARLAEEALPGKRNGAVDETAASAAVAAGPR
ncbi:sigma-E factor negative regulatory protein [Massilia sp. YIM B02763]|uniref:sigma-E factor negative regulatory protein n=1 Tax=Massilia sp. YIM B02763 TaxID=3050130 RepID=UPI0025B6B384|nr:sigma-E factor negative regulatory protein [Massilia sp. YIM B02763]MDN4052069.1 sigma-E factor negative regulatory protein [Massilia sp. YIM B02763]